MKNLTHNRSGRRKALVLTVVLSTASILTPTALVQVNPKNPKTTQVNPKTTQANPTTTQVNPKTPQVNPNNQIRPQETNTRTLSSVRITRPATNIKPGLLRANARPPIAFKPLEMIDPKTGKPVAGNALLTLDDGRTITAAKYYEQMNKLEAGLNKFGVSFRDQQKEVVLSEAVFDKAKVLSQIKSAKFVTPNPKKSAQLEAIAQKHRAYVRTANPYFGKRPPKAGAAKVSPGLFLQKVGTAVVNPGSVATSVPSLANIPKKRPDFVPGDRAVIGLNSDVETLPEINLDPGLAKAGKRASAVQINAAWSNVAFYVNYLSASTGPLTTKYVWQVVKASPDLDNFSPFGKAWAKEFGEEELSNWKTPPGLIGSGGVSFLTMHVAPSKREHLFQIDFAKLAGPPPKKPTLYLVRIVPVKADGSIGGYPSRPVLVSYGAEDPPKLDFPKYFPPPPAKFPVNNTHQEAPTSFGDPSVMSLELKSWVNSNGSVSHEEAEVGFDGGCSVLGQKFSLLKITAKGVIDASQSDSSGTVTFGGKVYGKINYLVLGIELPCKDCEQEKTAFLAFSSDYSTSLDEGFTFGFPIGPIDVSGTVGFRGTIGFGGHVFLNASGGFGNYGKPATLTSPLVIEAGPHVSAHVYLEGGAGIGVGGFDVVAIGVGGEVNLITAGFVVGVSFGPQGGQYFGRISELNVLNGRLYGWAKAGIWPFSKRWEVTLFDWGGYDMAASDPGHMTVFEGSL